MKSLFPNIQDILSEFLEEGDCQVTNIIEYNRRESGASDEIFLIFVSQGMGRFFKGVKEI